MKKLVMSLLIIVLTLLLVVPPAFAKSPIDKIVVSGPGLASPVEITAPAVLSNFSPWFGGFIDGTQVAPRPPQGGKSYDVLFYLKSPDNSLTAIYTFKYAPNPSGERGYIYLPGPVDQGYDLDVSTIFTGSEGKWLYATDKWDKGVYPLLPNGAPSDSSPLGSIRNVIIQSPWIGAPIFILLMATAGVWLIRRRQHLLA